MIIETLTLKNDNIKQLKLVEDITRGRKFNEDWVRQQLVNNGFDLKSSEKEQQIICLKPVISMLATYTNDNEKLLNVVTLNKLIDFPYTKNEIELKGDDLNGDSVKEAILELIPSNKTLTEEEEIVIPSQSMDNLIQFENVISSLKDYFSVKIDSKDDSGATYILTLKKTCPLFKVRINDNAKVFEMKVFNQGRNYKQYESLEKIFEIIEKNLGIGDLTSQLIIQTNDTQEQEPQQDNQEQNSQETDNIVDEQETNKKPFIPRADLLDEASRLRGELSDEVLAVLRRANEDYDPNNIGVWELAYKKCKDDEERDNLIQLFLNKKMNMSGKQVERNFVGLREWVNGRGFNIDKNLALRFIDNYSDKYPNQEIPSGVCSLLVDLANRKIISDTNNIGANILNDTDSILYYPKVYNNLNSTYNDVLDIINIYNKIYNTDFNKFKNNISKVTSTFNFLNPSALNSSQELAKEVCMGGDKLRDKDEVQTIYEMLTGKAYERDKDTTEVQDAQKIINDYKKDNKIDNLDKADTKTLRLVQDAINTTLNDNKEAETTFMNSLAKGTNLEQ